MKKLIAGLRSALGKNRATQSQNPEQTENIVEDLRAQALTLKPEDIGLSRKNFPKDVWGLLMETGIPESAYSLVVIGDGTTSLYFSDGGGIIGGGEHTNVRAASKTLLAGANLFFSEARRTTQYPLPASGEVKFYFLSYEGVYTYSAPEIELGEGRDKLSELFLWGHEVIAQLRAIEQSQHGPTDTAYDDSERDYLTKSELLINAIAGNDLLSVGQLLREGADPDYVDPKGTPALIIAASSKQKELVEMLLANGANPNVICHDPKRELDKTPALSFPAANGDLSIVRLLVSAGADLESSDGTGLSSLMSAAFMGHSEILEFLIEAGANIEARDHCGYTALMFAANAGNLEAARVLLNKGANVNARDNDNSTPIMFAAQHGFNDVVRILLTFRADPEAKGNHGLSAIGFAEQNNHSSTMSILLGHSSQ